MRLSSPVLLLLSASIAKGVEVYLSPHPSFLHSTLTPEHASAALSRHIGLEAFESVWDASELTHNEEVFVGQGPKSVVVMTMDEDDASGTVSSLFSRIITYLTIPVVILPATLHHAFTVETPPSTEALSLSSIISTYLHRASQDFSAIYSSFEFSTLKDVSSLESFLKSAQEPLFAGADLSSLKSTAESNSDEYDAVVDKLRSILERLVKDDHFHLAILTYPASSLTERAAAQQTQAPLPPDLPPPQQPIGSVSTCFTSLDACNNGTSTCSGRGKCVKASKAGRSCFVCTCGTTTTGEGSNVKTTHWAGESCERKDVSR